MKLFLALIVLGNCACSSFGFELRANVGKKTKSNSEQIVREILDSAYAARSRPSSYVSELQRATKALDKRGVSRSDFTDNEILCLWSYTDFLYLPLNKALRNGEMIGGWQVVADTLTSALKKLPDVSKFVYRGNSELPLEVLKTHRVSEKIIYKGFTSSSLDSSFLDNYYSFLVYSRHGKDISDFSSAPGESEVLFDKGTTFLVRAKSTKVKGNPNFYDGGVYFELEEIDVTSIAVK